MTTQAELPCTPSPPRLVIRFAAAAALLTALAACRADDTGISAYSAPDYRQAHPITLAYAPAELNLFLVRPGHTLDPRQSRDMREFLQEYRVHGRGGILALVPVVRGSRTPDLGAVRAALVAAGVPARALEVQLYSVPDTQLAAPLRLSFSKMQAKVPGPCGDWPQDLNGNALSTEGWENEPHPNFGCAYQTALANQVDDPIDFVRPRVEGRSDTVRRMKAIGDLRKGIDPSTAWRAPTADVSTSVSGGQ